MMCVVWWFVGIWLYWEHELHYDEVGYITISKAYLYENYINMTSTLVRPYLYPIILSVYFSLINKQPGDLFEDRIIISVFQLLLFMGSVMRLAQVTQARYGRRVGQSVLVGLLGMPFPVFTQIEVLTEGVSLSAFCWFVISVIGLPGAKQGAQLLARFGAVSTLASALVLIRTAFAPAMLVAITFIALYVVLIVISQPIKSFWKIVSLAIALTIPAFILITPQIYLMY